jgi:uncharacterized Zn-binding protein involved in type VI secretion
MGQPIARLGDQVQGICHHGKDDCPHSWTGTIVGGASSSLAEGQPIARIGDDCVTSCPHCGKATIVAGSSTVLAEGGGVAHLGDKVVSPGGQGTIVGSASTVISD